MMMNTLTVVGTFTATCQGPRTANVFEFHSVTSCYRTSIVQALSTLGSLQPPLFIATTEQVGSIMCGKSIAFSAFFGLYRMLLSRLVPGCASLIWMLCSLLATCNFTYMFNHAVMVRWLAALKRVGFLSGVSSVNAKRERGGDKEAALYQPLAFPDDRLLNLIKMVLVWGQRKSSSRFSFHVAFAFLMALVLLEVAGCVFCWWRLYLSELKLLQFGFFSLVRLYFFLPWHSWSVLSFSWPLPPLKWILSSSQATLFKNKHFNGSICPVKTDWLLWIWVKCVPSMLCYLNWMTRGISAHMAQSRSESEHKLSVWSWVPLDWCRSCSEYLPDLETCWENPRPSSSRLLKEF